MTFSRTRTLRWRLAMTTAALAIALATALLVNATHADSTAPGTIGARTAPFFPPAAAAGEVAAAQAGFQERFAALRGPGAAIPAASVIRDPGVDRAAAHAIVPASAAQLAKAGATAPGAQLWVAPRDDGTQCLLAQPADAQGPAELCSTLDEADAGYLFMTQSKSASDVELYGVVPDGVDAVTVAFADGSSTTLPVASNAYAAHFDKPTASIAFTDANGVDHKLVAGSDG